MKSKLSVCAAAMAIVLAGPALADTVPSYGDIGTPNTETYSFVATSTGNLSAYFVGADAAYDESVGVLVNGVANGVVGLPNHGSAAGDRLDFGNVKAGDKLTFFINVRNTNSTFYSDASLNEDKTNHVFSAAFGGGGKIPAGTYVGFEDLLHGGDHDYNDERYVFTNVTATIPEPSGVALVLAGLGLVGAAARRRRA